MSKFPDISAERAALEKFIADTDAQGNSASAADRALRTRASRLAMRLANPVRVAIVGLPGSGKSTLTNFLIGRSLIPTQSSMTRRPAVIVRHGSPERMIAGWWSGRQVAMQTLDFNAAAEQQPDYIEARLNNPVLSQLSFMDVPGMQGQSKELEQLLWIARRADILLWCTSASHPWSDAEQQLWANVPRRLYSQSLLLLTFSDTPEGKLGLDKKVAQLRASVNGQFRQVTPISAQEAIAAAPDGKVRDKAAWASSGGANLVRNLMTVAATVRNADQKAARDMMNAGFTPQANKPVLAPPKPQILAAAQASAVPSAPPPKRRPKPRQPDPKVEKIEEFEAESGDSLDKLLKREKHRLESREQSNISPLLLKINTIGVGLLKKLAEGKLKPDQVFSAFTALAEELSSKAGGANALKADGKWISRQLEEAFIQLTLLEVEAGEEQLLDAANIMLQITRDLAWAAKAPEVA
ncbi:MAG: dynamin family protein [Rhodobacteraceae bacterium]|nr:dynamin family protein [Paracoccaceae bacterium]